MSWGADINEMFLQHQTQADTKADVTPEDERMDEIFKVSWGALVKPGPSLFMVPSICFLKGKTLFLQKVAGKTAAPATASSLTQGLCYPWTYQVPVHGLVSVFRGRWASRRNWLMWFWKLRFPPSAVPKLEAQESWGVDQSESESECLRSRETIVQIPVWGLSSEYRCVEPGASFPLMGEPFMVKYLDASVGLRGAILSTRAKRSNKGVEEGG